MGIRGRQDVILRRGELSETGGCGDWHIGIIDCAKGMKVAGCFPALCTQFISVHSDMWVGIVGKDLESLRRSVDA